MSQESFTCPECKLTSYNPNDVAHRFCGNCQKFWPDPLKYPNVMKVYTVFDHPLDYPDHFVVTRHLITPEGTNGKDDSFLIMGKDLEVIREMLLTQFKLVPIGRYPEDDEKIVESWI